MSLSEPESAAVSAYPSLGPWPYPKLKPIILLVVTSHHAVPVLKDPRALRPLRGDRRIRGGKRIDTLRLELWILIGLKIDLNRN